MTKAAAPQPIAAVKVRPIRLFKVSQVGVLGCFAVGLSNGAFWSLAPVFAQREEGNVTFIAIFMSAAVLAGAVGQYPLGRLSDRIDRRKVIIFASLGAALAGVGLVLVGRFWEPGLLLAAGAFGLFAFPIYALSVAHLNDFVEADGFVEAASGLLLVFAAGAVLGPLIASAFMRFYGINALFAFTATIHLLTAAYALYRLTRRAPKPTDERVGFVDSIRVAQTVSAVDPLPDAPPESRQPGGEAEADSEGRSHESAAKD